MNYRCVALHCTRRATVHLVFSFGDLVPACAPHALATLYGPNVRMIRQVRPV